MKYKFYDIWSGSEAEQSNYLASTKEDSVTNIKAAEGESQCLLNKETKPRMKTWLLSWKVNLTVPWQAIKQLNWQSCNLAKTEPSKGTFVHCNLKI